MKSKSGVASGLRGPQSQWPSMTKCAEYSMCLGQTEHHWECGLWYHLDHSRLPFWIHELLLLPASHVEPTSPNPPCNNSQPLQGLQRLERLRGYGQPQSFGDMAQGPKEWHVPWLFLHRPGLLQR